MDLSPSMVARMHGKGIVYCKAKTRVKEITKGVLDGCAVAFHGDIDSRERAGVLDAFRTGERRKWFCCNERIGDGRRYTGY